MLDPEENFVFSILRLEFNVTMLVMRACNRKWLIQVLNACLVQHLLGILVSRDVHGLWVIRRNDLCTLSVRAISERLVRFSRKHFGRNSVILVGYISFGKHGHLQI